MHAAHLSNTAPRISDNTVSGSVLLGATLLEIVAIAHHPSVATADAGQAVTQIAGLTSRSGLVHGVLMALMLSLLFCLTTFAMRRGFARAPVRAGTIAYGSGVLVMLGAALVSGFVIGDVASFTPRDTPVDLQIGHRLLILCGALNQACARFAVVAMSAGIGFWSIDLLRDRGAARWIGALGCGISGITAVAVLGGSLRLDVAGIQTVVLLQGAWNLAVAVWLLRIDRTRSE